MTNPIKRRTFIKSSLVTASAVTSAKAAPALNINHNIQGANDQIRVGVIGCGGQGNWDSTDFQRQPNVKLVALCDVYDGSIKNTLMTQRLDVAKTTIYKDFRKLLEDKTIDAVVIATPDHWHALPMMAACQAGKDVYVEKPVSLTVAEGRKMVEAARQYKRVVQVGTQQRSARHFQRAVEIVQQGKLGKISRIHCWNTENRHPRGIRNEPDSEVPAGLDWDFWLGPAPKVAFNKNRFLENFRWFWDYSGGQMTDWGTHLLDIVHWAMNVDAPLSVAAMGNKFYIEDNRETPDTLTAMFEYPGFICTYESRFLNGRGPEEGRGYGILFYGSDATMFVDRSYFEIIPEMTFSRDDFQTQKTAAARMNVQRGDPSHFDHVKNFIECMRTRQNPVSDIEIAHRSTSAPHLANIALRSGRQIKWDGQREQILGDAEASKRLSKEYRAPWKL